MADQPITKAEQQEQNVEQVKTNAQPPEKFTGMKLGKPKTTAAGIPAVTNAVKHIFEEAGPIRGMTTLFKMNQFTGFDCPGCAWPDPDDKRSILGEYCENGAKAIAEEATLKRVDPQFFRKHSVKEIGTWSDYEIGKSGRVTHPMLLREGSDHYEPVSWEDAFGIIAKELNSLDSPDEAIFYTSGRTGNEAAFLYQLFVRMFGTNNLPDCSNMCHESSGKGLSATTGIGKGSVTLEDLENAEVVMVVGQNPGTNHPRMMTSLQVCKRNGGKIITVNPLPETGLMKFKHPQSVGDILGTGTQLTDIFLQVSVNADIALAKALMLLMLEAEDAAPGTVFDHEFIKTYAHGYQEFVDHLRTHDFQDMVKESGVEESLIREAADLLIHNEKIIICWAMGLTQQKNGVANIQEMANILFLKGAIGKPGAGTCPVRGHSNVQGDRTMGIWEAPKPAFLDKLQEVFKFEPPRHHGVDVVHAIKEMHAGNGKVFFAMGGNFISATPDTEYTAAALRKCNLTVHVSTKLNRSHVVHGKRALILPCLGRTEKDVQKEGTQFVTVENSMGVVHMSKGDLKPASKHLLSEPDIVVRLAEATLNGKSTINWSVLSDNYDRIRDMIEAVIPGFDNYNQRVRQKGGFYLPNGARVRKFNTPNGKANFTLNEVARHNLPEGYYKMITLRTHDQYNTTIYGLDDRYRGIYNERRVVMMNVEDMDREVLSKGQMVNLLGHYRGEIRRADKYLIVPYDIPKGCIGTYFPETNVLVPIDSTADKSNTPTSKLIVCSIEKIKE
ncbi:MAG: FdhF/YdeP family oxidoreductase [Bacteroidota bacterium]